MIDFIRQTRETAIYERTLGQQFRKIETLFTHSLEKWEFDLNPNKNNDSLMGRKYLYAPMEHDNRIVPVKLTVKEFKDIKTEKRIYSIEAIDIELKSTTSP